jgi:hypothetical protein
LLPKSVIDESKNILFAKELNQFSSLLQMMELYKNYEKEVYGKIKLYARSTLEELKLFKINKTKNKDETTKEEMKDTKSEWKDKSPGKDWNTLKKKQDMGKPMSAEIKCTRCSNVMSRVVNGSRTFLGINPKLKMEIQESIKKKFKTFFDKFKIGEVVPMTPNDATATVQQMLFEFPDSQSQ